MSTTLSQVALLTQLRVDTSYPSPDTIRVAVVGEIDLATAHGAAARLGVECPCHPGPWWTSPVGATDSSTT